MVKFPFSASTGQVSHRRPNNAGGPTMRRGEMNQGASTPWPFIRAVEEKFGPLSVDLAANVGNHKASLWLGPGSTVALRLGQPPPYNSFDVDWHTFSGLCWLNPPYAQITPWARKCAVESQLGARILLLVPASIGANWYWDWVVPFADVYSIGRLVFDNCYDREGKLITNPYPKDLILCHYGVGTGKSYSDSHLGGRAELIRWRVSSLTK